jgi:hypothetical protein
MKPQTVVLAEMIKGYENGRTMLVTVEDLTKVARIQISNWLGERLEIPKVPKVEYGGWGDHFNIETLGRALSYYGHDFDLWSGLTNGYQFASLRKCLDTEALIGNTKGSKP